MASNTFSSVNKNKQSNVYSFVTPGRQMFLSRSQNPVHHQIQSCINSVTSSWDLKPWLHFSSLWHCFVCLFTSQFFACRSRFHFVKKKKKNRQPPPPIWTTWFVSVMSELVWRLCCYIDFAACLSFSHSFICFDWWPCFLLLILKALLPGVQVFTVMPPPHPSHPMLNQGEPFSPCCSGWFTVSGVCCILYYTHLLISYVNLH